MTGNSKKSYITKRANLLWEVGKNEQTKFTDERYNKKKQNNWTKTAMDQKTQQGGSILGNIIKLGAKLGASNLLKRGVSTGTKALSSEICKRLRNELIKE